MSNPDTPRYLIQLCAHADLKQSHFVGRCGRFDVYRDNNPRPENGYWWVVSGTKVRNHNLLCYRNQEFRIITGMVYLSEDLKEYIRIRAMLGV